MNADLPVLNLESVRIAFEDDDAGLSDLLELVLSTASTDLGALEAAIAARDEALAGELAHGLKGASSNVGAEEFAALAASLEGAARGPQWPLVQERFAQLQAAFVRLRSCIEAFCASVQP